MKARIAINGFGRIGRNIVRALYESGRHSEITVVAINELAETASMVHLLKYDTSHGHFSWDVYQEHERIFIGNDSVHVLHERTIDMLPWRNLGIDIVLDCTGVYGNREHGEEHIKAGAKKVLFSHPSNDDLDAIIIYGVNHQILKDSHRIVSNASCTANCVIPIIKLLNDAYEIELGTITIIHSAMHDQQVIDAYHSDSRKMRAASQSIVPVDTKLTTWISQIFPQFNNRFEAIAVRVPTINVTAIDLNIIVRKAVKVYEVNLLLQKATQETFRNILDYTELPLVSIDFNHNSHSAIIDGTQTRVSGACLIKTLAWCDNEWGFANRMLDTALSMTLHNLR